MHHVTTFWSTTAYRRGIPLDYNAAEKFHPPQRWGGQGGKAAVQGQVESDKDQKETTTKRAASLIHVVFTPRWGQEAGLGPFPSSYPQGWKRTHIFLINLAQFPGTSPPSSNGRDWEPDPRLRKKITLFCSVESRLRTSGIASWCLQPWWPWARWSAQSCSGAGTHPL